MRYVGKSQKDFFTFYEQKVYLQWCQGVRFALRAVGVIQRQVTGVF